MEKQQLAAVERGSRLSNWQPHIILKYNGSVKYWEEGIVEGRRMGMEGKRTKKPEA